MSACWGGAWEQGSIFESQGCYAFEGFYWAGPSVQPFYAGEGCVPIRSSNSIEMSLQDSHCHTQSPCSHGAHVSPVVGGRIIAVCGCVHGCVCVCVCVCGMCDVCTCTCLPCDCSPNFNPILYTSGHVVTNPFHSEQTT